MDKNQQHLMQDIDTEKEVMITGAPAKSQNLYSK